MKVDFAARPGGIEGLLIVTMKQIGDERGTVRELFRRSAFEHGGIELGVLQQINITESRRPAIRGMHAEEMTKLVTIALGEAFAAFVDLRPGSPTRGRTETVALRAGLAVLVPSGVANGFQAVSDVVQYVYCFDREWQPGMPGAACNPLDPALAISWPLPVDPDDPAQISTKDRGAPMFADLEEADS